MLILSRKEGEKIIIDYQGTRIEIVVSYIDRGKVRLGIDAPRNIPVYREELLRDGPSEGQPTD